MRRRALTVLDSYGSLLVLLLANFFLLEVVDDPRWGALGSTLLAAVALIVAISDPATGHTVNRRQARLDRRLCAARADRPVRRLGVGRRPRLPAAGRAARHRDASRHAQPRAAPPAHHARDGARCALLVRALGLLFAFAYLALDPLLDGPFFAQPGPHQESEYLYFSFVTLTTLGFGDLSPAVGLPQALTALEALLGQVFLVTLVARLVTLWVRQDDSAPRAS